MRTTSILPRGLEIIFEDLAVRVSKIWTLKYKKMEKVILYLQKKREESAHSSDCKQWLIWSFNHLCLTNTQRSYNCTCHNLTPGFGSLVSKVNQQVQSSVLPKKIQLKAPPVTPAQNCVSKLVSSELHIAAACLFPASKLPKCDVFIPHEGVTMPSDVPSRSFSLTSTL